MYVVRFNVKKYFNTLRVAHICRIYIYIFWKGKNENKKIEIWNKLWPYVICDHKQVFHRPELHISISSSFQCFHYNIYNIVMYLAGATRGKRKNDVRNGYVKKTRSRRWWKCREIWKIIIKFNDCMALHTKQELRKIWHKTSYSVIKLWKWRKLIKWFVALDGRQKKIERNFQVKRRMKT